MIDIMNLGWSKLILQGNVLKLLGNEKTNIQRIQMTIKYLCTQVYLKQWNCAQKILTLELSILMVWFILLCECSVLTFFALSRFPQLDPLWLCLFYYCWEIFFKNPRQNKDDWSLSTEIFFSNVWINIPAFYLHERAEITNRRRDVYLFVFCLFSWLVISVDRYHSRLLPVVWRWSCLYLF